MLRNSSRFFSALRAGAATTSTAATATTTTTTTMTKPRSSAPALLRATDLIKGAAASTMSSSSTRLGDSSSSSSPPAAATSIGDAGQFAISAFEGAKMELLEKRGQQQQQQQQQSPQDFEPPLADVFGTDDVSSMRDAVCVLLRAFCGSGQITKARRLFHQFLREVPPQGRSSAVFDTWLQLLVQQPSVNRAEIQILLDKMNHPTTTSDPNRGGGPGGGGPGGGPGGGIARTALTYQSLIEAHIRLQLDPSPLYREMLARGIEPTPNVLSLLAKGVAPFRTKEAEEADAGFHHAVLKDYLRKARPGAAADYSIGFLKQRFLAFVASPDAPPELALSLLFELEQRCVVECVSLKEVVDRVPIVQLLLRCARCGDAATVEGVIGCMERHLIPKSADILALTLWCHAMAASVGAAFDTLEDMHRRGYLDHVDHTRKFVIEALGTPIEKHYLTILAESLSTPELIDKAFFYLESRHKQGLSVSVHALDVIVLACGKTGDEGRAVETIEAYPSLGVQPRIQSYNALLLSCSGKNKARRHRSVFEAMQRRGITPNYHTLRILIRQAVLCNNIEEALEYLDKAKATPSVRLDVEMVLAVFERACRVGDAETALHASRVAMDCDIGIDPAILKVGAERLAELGVDAAALLEMVPAHERLRGRHGLARRN